MLEGYDGIYFFAIWKEMDWTQAWGVERMDGGQNP